MELIAEYWICDKIYHIKKRRERQNKRKFIFISFVLLFFFEIIFLHFANFQTIVWKTYFATAFIIFSLSLTHFMFFSRLSILFRWIKHNKLSSLMAKKKNREKCLLLLFLENKKLFVLIYLWKWKLKKEKK